MEPEIEITPAMRASGENAVLMRLGGADLGGSFEPGELAVWVYRAMEHCRLTGRDPNDG